jgi:EmrB/QacA subfamily drug resistance transporter
MPTDEALRKRLTLAACCFSLFMVTLDGTIVNVALPTIQHQLNASLSGLQWVLDAYTLVLASLLLSAGAVGDRIGRRRVFHTGLIVFTVASLLCSAAPTLGVLIAFRMIQAVGGAMLIPSTLSIIANTFTDAHERAVAIGIWGAVSGVSIAIGPVLGGILVDAISWRAIFWVNLPIGLVAMLMSVRFIGESRAPVPRRIDGPGQTLAVAFLALVTYALIEGPTYGWGSPTILALFGASALLLLAFLVVESRRQEPLIDLSFFRSPPFTGSSAIAFIAFVGFVGFIFLNTLYLQEVRGYSALLAGLASLPATAAIIFASPIAGVITGRRGPRRPIVTGSCFMAVGTAVLLATSPTVSIWILFLGYVLIGWGMGLINPPITTAAIAGMPPEQAGVASGITGAARQVGAVFGVALIGSVVTSGFRANLSDRLTALHLPSGLRHQVESVVASGSGAHPVAGQGGLAEAILHAVGVAFTDAMHAGYLIAAVAAAIAAVLGWVTMAPRWTAPAQAPAAEPAEAVDEDLVAVVTIYDPPRELAPELGRLAERATGEGGTPAAGVRGPAHGEERER